MEYEETKKVSELKDIERMRGLRISRKSDKLSKSRELLVFYLFYLILALAIQSGRLYTIDGIARYNLTKSIVDHHTITLDHTDTPH